MFDVLEIIVSNETYKERKKSLIYYKCFEEEFVLL